MATLTIRQLDEKLVRKIKTRAAEAGRSMEEEVRVLLDHAYGEEEQRARQRTFADQQRKLMQEGKLPKSDIETYELLHEMREERDQQLMEAITGKYDADR